MMTPPDARTVASEQRGAMLRVFGGTALAFIALFIVAISVRPDLMPMAVSMMMSLMPHVTP